MKTETKNRRDGVENYCGYANVSIVDMCLLWTIYAYNTTIIVDMCPYSYLCIIHTDNLR